MKGLSPLEIESKLLQLPTKLYKLGVDVVKAHEVFLNAEKTYEDVRDNAFLQAKAANQEMTGPELKAHASQVSSGERLNMILAQAKYESAKNAADACDKLLGAYQSVIKLRSSEMRSGVLQDNYSQSRS